LSHLRRALAPEGTLVIVGGEGGGKWFGGIDRQLRAQMLSPFVRQKLGTLIAVARKDDLQVLREFLEAGTVEPVVDRTFALSEVAEAIRYLREGRARGRSCRDVGQTRAEAPGEDRQHRLWSAAQVAARGRTAGVVDPAGAHLRVAHASADAQDADRSAHRLAAAHPGATVSAGGAG